MKRYLTVHNKGPFLQRAVEMGLKVRFVRELPATDLFFHTCCRGTEYGGPVSPAFVFEVSGGTRKLLKKLPGVRRIRTEDRAHSGPIYVRVC